MALAFGQVLFKTAADQLDDSGNPASMIQIVFSVPMISACTLYALSIIVYVSLLRKVPLSQAYLFSIAGAAIVPFLAWAVFKEPISMRYVIGAVLVVVGISVSTLS
ncbi:MAG: hypothetical protein AAFP00_02415 [Bacteroidota bacterium]